MTAFAYLSGVVHGDGWVTRSIGLRVADEDFAAAFAAALAAAFGCAARPRRDERGYWLVRTGNATGRFNGLLTFEPATDAERGAWLRGLFDSEGNVSLRHLPHVSENSYERRVAIYSTCVPTLERATAYLAALGIVTVLTATKNSARHKGTKIVYQLRVRCGREAYARFAERVGSSLGRKAAVLRAIPGSYRPVGSDHCRRAQQLGAAVRRQRALTVTLPAVLAGIRELVARGMRPAQRACSVIPGYNGVRRYYRDSELVAMATTG